MVGQNQNWERSDQPKAQLTKNLFLLERILWLVAYAPSSDFAKATLNLCLVNIALAGAKFIPTLGVEDY